MATAPTVSEMLSRVEQKTGKRLSKREKQILPLLAKGRTNREIANYLDIGEGTTKNYVSGLFVKLKVKNRMQASALFVQHESGPSGAAEVADGSCRIASLGGVQDATVLEFREFFGEWPDSAQMSVREVRYEPETGIIAVVYQDGARSRFVTELWNGCEYEGTGDMWAGEG